MGLTVIRTALPQTMWHQLVLLMITPPAAPARPASAVDGAVPLPLLLMTQQMVVV